MTKAEIYEKKLRDLRDELDKVRCEILSENIDEESQYTDGTLSKIVDKLSSVAILVGLSDFCE